MVNFCAVIGCSNTAVMGRSFYRIPAVIHNQGEQTEHLSSQRRNAWLAALARADLNTANLSQYRVCSDHFISGKPAKLYDATNPDWAPTLNMGHNKVKPTSLERFNRSTERAAKRKKIDAEQMLDQDQDEEEANMVEEENHEVAEVQTDMKCEDVDSLENEVQKLTLENLELKKSLSDFKLTEDAFRGNNDKVRYFTGLPNFAILMAVFKLVLPSLSQNERCSLGKFQQMMLTLMRMRLNLPKTMLSHWFQVSPSTVSRTYANVVDVMYAKLKCLIVWPEREDLIKTMPMDFRKHFKKNVAIVIDCFEIFIERPSNLKARAMTWSSYKHNNTVKYLIGIIPQGVISYISCGWGGRVSDKYLTEHSDLLRKLVPGDVVLADRGFDIADSLGSVCAQLVMPAFTRGKSQLSAMEVETTRKIANVRIHVERVIGNLRQKYTFFDSVIHVDHLICPKGDIPMLDKEVLICCALVNLNESVVPFN